MKTQKKVILSTAMAIFVIFSAITVILVVNWVTAPNENLLVKAAGNDDLVKFKKIAARGVSLDAQEKGMLGQTALIASTLANGTNVFFYLLSAGVKVDARDREGKIALMSAVMLGDANLPKIKALIAAGADVNARDSNGSSVLKFAEWAGAGGCPVTSTVSLLKQHGAKE